MLAGREPSKTRRWLLWAWAPRGWGQDSRAGQGALEGHSENVLRLWTDQVAAQGGLVTVDRGQPSRLGARRLPGPSTAPAPRRWPCSPLASRCMCVAVS